MSQRAASRGLLLCVLCISVALAGTAGAQTTAPGTITFSPASVGLSVGEASQTITAQITFPVGAPAPTGPQTLNFMYLPYGVTTNPSTISYSFPTGSLTTTVTFQLVAAPFATAGPGSMLVYQVPSYASGSLSWDINGLAVQPSGLTLAPGTESDDMTAFVSYPSDVFPTGPQQLVFSGLPPGASSVPDPATFVIVQVPAAVVTFRIAVGADTPAGTYDVTVQTSPAGSGTDTFVLTVPMQGALSATLEKAAVAACPGGPPVQNLLTIVPLEGYEGSPTITFPALPGELEVTPASIPVPALPPQQTVPITVAAKAGAVPGLKVVNVRVSDPRGPATVTSFSVNVGASDFTPVVSPESVTLTAGGPTVIATASLAPGACSPPSRITVTPVGLPPGVTVTPSSADLVGPAYAPVEFTLTATAIAPAGSLPVAFAFSPSTGAPKNVGVPVTVVRTGRIGVTVERTSMDLCAGGAPAPNTLVIVPVDGYTGTPAVTFPNLPAGLTVTPATIPVPTLPPSQVVPFTVAAAPGTAPGERTVSVLVSDPRGISTTQTFAVNVLSPVFTPIVPPGVTLLNAGGAPVQVPVMIAPEACGPTSAVTVTPSELPPGVTVSPASVQLLPPAFAAVGFDFQASASAAPGPSTITFTFTPAAGFARTAKFSFTVCGPPGAPVSPGVRPKGNPSGPVTATDFLDLVWSAPASGFVPTRYDWRVNGGAWTSAAGTSASAPPRGSVDPVQLFVRGYSCSPERGPGPEATSPVYSLAPPVASFSVPASIVAGRPVTFTDTSSPQATSWLWFPGDGMAATTVQSPTVTFPAAGPKVVVLVATNGSGSSTKATTVNVLAASPAREAGLAVRALLREPDGRLALAAVEVAPGTTLLLRRLAGEGEAVAFLRLVDADGRVVLERRLVLAAGEEARHDLSAWGTTGTFRVEVVGPEGLDAAVEEPALRLGGPEVPVSPRRGSAR